jgi:pimeloyl-ACP methyl ester carboxylesterase
MPIIDTGRLRMGYEIQGQGHPLLLIAGVGYGRWFWHKIVPGLGRHFRVITFDNRGAGETDKPAGPYSVPMMAEDTAALLDALGLADVYLMGHSLGGFIAQELAVRRPELVGKLILASTTHGGPDAIPITPEALAVLTDRQGDPEELVRRGIAVAGAPGFAERNPEVVQELVEYRMSNPVPPAQYQAQVMAGAGMGEFTREQVAERLAAIQVPTLILFGEHDRVVPPGNAQLLAEKIQGARAVILPAAGHIFPLEIPEATVAVIREFLLG